MFTNWVHKFKHRKGQHNQKRHGWRYSAGVPLSRLRQQRGMADEGYDPAAEWDEFKRRARGGVVKVKPPKPVAPTLTPGEISQKALDDYRASVGKFDHKKVLEYQRQYELGQKLNNDSLKLWQNKYKKHWTDQQLQDETAKLAAKIQKNKAWLDAHQDDNAALIVFHKQQEYYQTMKDHYNTAFDANLKKASEMRAKIQPNLDRITAIKKDMTDAIADALSKNKLPGGQYHKSPERDAIEKPFREKLKAENEIVQKTLFPKGGTKLTITNETAKGTDPTTSPDVNRGIERFEQMAKPNPFLEYSPVEFNIVSTNRAWYRRGGLGGTIKVDRYEEKATTCHELGHHLEYSDPLIRRKAMEFLATRTAGEQTKRFYDIIHKGYAKDEVGKPDKFMNAYTGKIYTDGATEVISMGFTHMTSELSMWVKLDPGHFDFMYAILNT